MASPLMNLCDPVFKTIVTCDTVNSEGYEVTNLLSDDTHKKKKGFLCDRFIKPPVEVTFKFPFDVNIRFIQLGAEVGQQKSSGIEFLSSSVPYNSLLCSSTSDSKGQPKSKLAFSPISERIGSVFLDHAHRGVVLFCPLHYGRQNLNPVPNIRSDFTQISMVWKKRGVIAHASSLTVRIFKTYGSSVPAIGSIEIWGGPSSCVPSHKVSEIMNLWKSACQIKPAPVNDDLVKNVTSSVPHKPSDQFMLQDVPEEFLDAITWEIMALPMVLPSGKVVDQQTLDLHAKAEANWGRHPSDPFTGMLFSEGCRPLLDSALKSRIDRFLVLNQDRKDLKTVPRTVGRAQSQICHQTVYGRNNQAFLDAVGRKRKHHSISSPTCDSTVSKVVTLSPVISKVQDSLVQSHCSTSLKDQGRSLQPDDKDTVGTNVCEKLRPTADSSRKQNESSASLGNYIQCITVDDDTESRVESKTHEERLDDSLDCALKAVLSGLPSFVNPPSPKLNLKTCGSCKNSSSIYSLPCSHFLCRVCLLRESKQKSSKCIICELEFRSSDPVFHHD